MQDVLLHLFFHKREKEANAMAKNLAVSPGSGRSEMLWTAVKGVLGAGRKPRAKPRSVALAGFLRWVSSSFDLLSGELGADVQSLCAEETTGAKCLRISLLCHPTSLAGLDAHRRGD